MTLSARGGAGLPIFRFDDDDDDDDDDGHDGHDDDDGNCTSTAVGSCRPLAVDLRTTSCR